MAVMTSKEQMALEALRREEEERERARRRDEIELQINQIDIRLTTMRSLISDLISGKQKLNASLVEWDEQKALYNGNVILSEVVIINVFEGKIADKIKDDLETCISQMDLTYVKVAELKENVDLQITKLRQQVSFLNNNRRLLSAELNSI